MMTLLSVLLLGLIMGPILLRVIGGLLPGKWGAALGRWFAYSGLRMGDAWTAHETEGSRYQLKHLEKDDDKPGVLLDGDDREYEDVGLMGYIDAGGKSVPFGTSYDEHRVVSSPLVSKIGEKYGQLSTDGGVEDMEKGPAGIFDDRRSINWFRDNALLGRARDGNHVVEVVNGAVEIPRAAVADVKETVNVLSHAGDPEQPKRAANNAENAERERRGDPGLMGHVSRLAYVMIGGLLVWLATDSGGSGGDAAGSVTGTIAYHGLMLIGVM